MLSQFLTDEIEIKVRTKTGENDLHEPIFEEETSTTFMGLYADKVYQRLDASGRVITLTSQILCEAEVDVSVGDILYRNSVAYEVKNVSTESADLSQLLGLVNYES